MTKLEYFEKNGFSETGKTYVVVGEDSYSIKDWLKEQGCKYNPFLKWHSAQTFKLPKDFQWVVFDFDDIMTWNEEEEDAIYLETAKNTIEKSINLVTPPSKSEYLGAVGERLRNLTAILSSRRTFNGIYGLTYIYTFYRGNDCLVWFSQVELNIPDGSVVDLTGTVKAHEEFRGVHTTKINRCIVKEIA